MYTIFPKTVEKYINSHPLQWSHRCSMIDVNTFFARFGKCGLIGAVGLDN